MTINRVLKDDNLLQYTEKEFIEDMKILVAIDSFKGSVTSPELNTSVAQALLSVDKQLVIETRAIADGGEGSLVALSQTVAGRWHQVKTIDLLRRPIKVAYYRHAKQAFIESASIIGIDKITSNSVTYAQATSYGLGLAVKDAIQKGATQIEIMLGGTGTSDGGKGFLESLNYDFMTGRSYLDTLASPVTLLGLTDVTNPYHGPQGFAAVFGPQKGGSLSQIEETDQIASNFAKKVFCQTTIDLQTIPGSGAAGGLGGAIVLLGGTLTSGFSRIAELLNLDNSLQSCDLVITGEGCLDTQSQSGKVPVAIARMAKKYQVPTIALCGSVKIETGLAAEDFLAVFSIQQQPISLEAAIDKTTTLSNIKILAANLMLLIAQFNK
ncbi:TPA: glycerate kinase [Streptococcus pyogenes]|nr:glycerate kinase [Streptococcus pyogenes]EZK84458.1 glycerate kinase [Streptococcus pyogenes ABC020015294]EZL53442.1 glycerate kinase [Streptococcus pyogenes ABC020029711]EZL68786.1 glycerate kinase [Streptococcus pyogenes ABC020005887]EZM08365.1 glycerate kinase [Streptococcus pyogenes ABC020051161]EZM12468.1 glycerate kinase [Streptococcus pyogenes ABC020056020]EZM72330.1 glycerate kinase [Streptococcus pyogenes ABC020056765]EZM75774.1 glycerate kinase [Streptococcus pyogenes ABC0200479